VHLWKAARTGIRLLVGCAAAPLAAQPGGAQPGAAVRLTVLDAGSGLPVGGALVSAAMSDSVWTPDALTGPTGLRLVALPRPGSWRLRVRRIGFAPWTSEPITVTAGDPVPLSVRVDARPITLATIDIRAAAASSTGCERSPTSTSAVGILWEEARKALQTSAIVQRDAAVRFLATSFERTLSTTGRVEKDSTSPPELWRQRPFRARAAADLSANGWARILPDGSMLFDAPDEASLLSREFEIEHCFAISRQKRKGLVGLAFAPVTERATPDITGTIWLDAANVQLTKIDFLYYNPPPPARGDLGGEVTFLRLDDGRWIVSAWRIRMPRLGISSADGRTILIGYVEQGGTTSLAPH
jgi:hypothetical protein